MNPIKYFINKFFKCYKISFNLRRDSSEYLTRLPSKLLADLLFPHTVFKTAHIVITKWNRGTYNGELYGMWILSQ